MSLDVVLNNVADTTSVTTITRKTKVAVWVTGGTANVLYDGAVITALAVGDYKLIELGEGEQLTFTATSASTTAKIKHLNPAT